MTSRNPRSWKKFIRTKKAELRRAGTPDADVKTIIASEYARLKIAPAAPVEKKPSKKAKAGKTKKTSK
ncbi:MAG: hypothetical protein AAB343_00620 [Patescibacteria group bacterium]